MRYLVLALVMAGPDPQPDPDRIPGSAVFGWRRDGTGVYPDPKPPTEWSRISRTLMGLKCQAKRPKGADAGAAHSAAQGYIPQWLVLGPLDAADETKSLLQPAVPGEADLQPDEGQKTGGAAWSSLACEDTTL